MAKYTVIAGHNPDTANRITFQQRPAAYRYAYKRWYEALGSLGGRDTAWGRLGAETLDNWLIHRELDACLAADPHGSFSVAIVRERPYAAS